MRFLLAVVFLLAGCAGGNATTLPVGDSPLPSPTPVVTPTLAPEPSVETTSWDEYIAWSVPMSERLSTHMTAVGAALDAGDISTVYREGSEIERATADGLLWLQTRTPEECWEPTYTSLLAGYTALHASWDVMLPVLAAFPASDANAINEAARLLQESTKHLDAATESTPISGAACR